MLTNALLLMMVATQSEGVEVTGYLETRAAWQRAFVDSLPRMTGLAEGNIRLRLRPDERVGVDADGSLVWQDAWLAVEGRKDALEYRPHAVLSELYLGLNPHDSFNLTVGKKRVVWGSGLAFNPTDILNPPKDPTDPSSQRAGAWMIRAEVPRENFTVSLVGAARVTREYSGLPVALGTYPSYPTLEAEQGWVPDDRDDEPHLAAVARLYALLWDTDINLMYAFTHLYNDAFERKNRLGLSLSRTFDAWEVHAEVLGQTGSARLYVDPECSTPQACLIQGRSIVSRPFLGDATVNPRALVGARYLFEDSAMFSAEYYYVGDGYTPEQLTDLITLIRSNPTLAASMQGRTRNEGTPQRYTFDPLRRHYLMASYSKPQVFDDFVLSASLLLGLEDLSGQIVPQIAWTPKEWIQLTAAAYVPFEGLESLGVEVNGERITEMSLSPIGTRVMLAARLFY